VCNCLIGMFTRTSPSSEAQGLHSMYWYSMFLSLTTLAMAESPSGQRDSLHMGRAVRSCAGETYAPLSTRIHVEVRCWSTSALGSPDRHTLPVVYETVVRQALAILAEHQHGLDYIPTYHPTKAHVHACQLFKVFFQKAMSLESLRC